MTAYLYAIGPVEGAVKIGFASDVRSRLGAIQTGNPAPLVCHFMVEDDCAPALERALHILFANKRVYGEWFDVSPAEIRAELVKIGHTVLDLPFGPARGMRGELSPEDLNSLLAKKCEAPLFARWREAMGWTLSGAAVELGISRNMPAKYESGKARVPGYVSLACAALAMGIKPWPE